MPGRLIGRTIDSESIYPRSNRGWATEKRNKNGWFQLEIER